MSQHWSSILTLLALVVLANGLPALLGLLLDPARPLDGGTLMADGRPLFGPSKTWRGLAVAAVGTMLGGLALGLHWTLGIGVAAGAMLGDLIASCTKRRLGRPAGATVPILDQIPEVAIPALVAKTELALSWPDVTVVILAFVLLDLSLTPLGRRLFGARGRIRRA
jgi:hypothetical protein